MSKIYIVGSLRNDIIPDVANRIEAETGWEAFDDWFSAGPEADDFWKAHQRRRGRTYSEALRGHAAGNTFRFDRGHLDTADAGLLVLPAGRSGHLELGYLSGRKVPTMILLDEETEQNRWDVMTQFAGLVTKDLGEIIDAIRRIEV